MYIAALLLMYMYVRMSVCWVIIMRSTNCYCVIFKLKPRYQSHLTFLGGLCTCQEPVVQWLSSPFKSCALRLDMYIYVHT